MPVARSYHQSMYRMQQIYSMSFEVVTPETVAGTHPSLSLHDTFDPIGLIIGG